MRHLVLALMIALLPLRGWVGNAMAMPTITASMAAHSTADSPTDASTNATKNIALHAQPERVAGHLSSENLGMQHSDCPGHAMHATQAGDANSGTGNAQEHSQGGCSDCQLCHAVAMLGLGASPAVLSPAPVRPATLAPAWRSAELQTGFKPPIS